jgi:beta-lactam-binding protein with PASTA domain
VKTIRGIAVGLVLAVIVTSMGIAAAAAVPEDRIGASPDDCVAQGAPTIKVPDLRGKFLRVAIRKVEKLGLTVVGYGTPPSDSTAATARVWAQKPSGGERVWRGACMGFRTGCATSGDAPVTVPDVRGKLLRVAIRIVTKRGLTVVGYGTPPSDSTAAIARVWAQKPSGGERAWLGACIGFRTR